MSRNASFLSACTTSRMVFRLLIVGAIVPLASDGIAMLGHRFGLYGAQSVAVVHTALMSVLFMAIVAGEALALRSANDQRVGGLRQVRKSEARLRLQIQRMPIACITFARDHTVTSWNPAAERIFGYSESEMVGRSFEPLVVGGLTPELQLVIQRLFEGDATAHSINENCTKDGRIIICNWTNTPMVEADGTVVGVLCMAEDITEQRRAQIRLLETETRHRQIVDQLPHFIFGLDTEDRYTVANAASCRFFGRAEADIIGRTALELGVEPEYARVWTEQNAKTRASGMAETVDMTFPVEGILRSFRATTSPVRDLSGAIVGVSGISIDMTELRAAEATAQRLLRAVEQLDEVVFTTDREGTITYVNPAFEEVYGFSREEAVGKTPRILKSGERTRDECAAFWGELLAGRSVRIEYRNRRKDRSLVDVNSSASPVFDDQGGISGFIAVQRDVTAQNRAAEERRRFDERLGHLARMESLGTLAGGIAHDFNNILSIVLTHTSLLERRHDDPAVVSRVTNTIGQAVQRGATLARQILTFARRTDLKREPVDLTRLILELDSMISETFPRTVQVTIDIDPRLPSVSADAGQVHQALLNLCVNARDAMPEGGELTIEARLASAASMKAQFPDARAQDYVMVSVRDTGTGINAETRKHIFEPFFTTKEKGKGTGLGLAVVYGVVNNHGGLVDVHTRVGEGTIFRLYLPLEPCDTVQPDNRLHQVAGGTESVLLIEDEPALLDSLCLQLGAHGYRVRTAANGVDAIAHCRNGGGIPDAVVMDLGMPKMSAIDLLRSLREIAPRLPIVAMTGYVDHDVHASVVAAGVQKIVSKPFEIGELLTALRGVL